MFYLSLLLMMYGLAGVFIALAVLHLAVTIMVKMFPNDRESEE
jgi:uncharacterized membrane protein YqjE